MSWSNDPSQPNPTYPAGYAQPGAQGGFAPLPGQPAYGAPGGFRAPAMPGYPAPGQPHMLPAPHRIRAIRATRRLPATRGARPPAAPAKYAPDYQQPPAGTPYQPAYTQPGYPGTSHAPPPAGTNYLTPTPGPGYPVPTPGGFPMPGATSEPITTLDPPHVMYRGIEVHNPLYEGGITVWQYGTKEVNNDCNRIENASVGQLISILTSLGPLKLGLVARDFRSAKGETLDQFVKNKTSGDVEAGILGLVLGPIAYDARRVKDAGRNDSLLVELLLDLSRTDINLLGYVYERNNGTPLKGGVYESIFDPNPILRPYFPPPASLPPPTTTTPDTSWSNMTRPPAPAPMKGNDPVQLLEQDVATLLQSGHAFFTILTGRTHAHLVDICRVYPTKHKDRHNRNSLSKDVNSEFSGHDRTALLYIIAGAEAVDKQLDRVVDVYPTLDLRAFRDANLLHAATGWGTNDLLVMRILRAHWSHERMDAIKAAYLTLYGEKLEKRVKDKNHGKFEDLLIALINGPALRA
ncbi:hypothetical protein B0H14DRAFT_3425449 [Mycena olivaceomarginata]|nr:hypothetical protein B0H14DRAFT_3425449 [Mycena olivaceomarginata]